MPYIQSKDNRRYIDAVVKEFMEIVTFVSGEINITGKLNYFLFKLAKKSCHNYEDYRNFIGELEAAKLEIYRRQVAPYEDNKIWENGDVL